MPALQREAAWSKERLLGGLQQSVPQNGRVHLHIIDFLAGVYHPGRNYYKIIPQNHYFCNIFVVFLWFVLAECRVFL